MKKVAILTNIISKYREDFYDRILSSEEFQFDVFCQKNVFGVNVPSIHDKYKKNVILVNFIALKEEKIVIQFLPFLSIVRKYDIFIIDGNPRNLSHLFMSFILRIFKKKIIIWSMIHSSNNNILLKKIRLAWIKLFHFHFVYNDYEKSFLQKNGFLNHIIIPMNNGLNQDLINQYISNWDNSRLTEWKKDNNLEDKTLLISCARLLKKAKFDLFIKILPEILIQFPSVMWVLVGNGPEKKNLIQLAKNYNILDNIIFLGESYDLQKVTPWFLSSTIFIHPGTIGLSLNQAFGYGLPVVTNNNSKNHAPEFYIFEDNKCGKLFTDNDSFSLYNVIVELLQYRNNLKIISEYNWNLVNTRFNTRIMSENLFKLLRMC